VELTEGQKKAIKKAKPWYNDRNKQVFEIAGPAGTGKTTIIFVIASELGLDINHEVLFCAYVGKAALNMRMHGIHARTIHSSMYDLIENKYKMDDDGNVIITDNKMIFRKKEFLDPNIKLIYIDEGSMVDEKMRNDILSFGLPVIVTGDLNQLPPVFGKSGFLQDPDIILWEIMRQKKDHPIIYLSYLARTGKPIPYGKYGKRCFVISPEQVTDKMLLLSDVIICGKNNTREALNNHIRQNILGIKSKLPVQNDKLICRKNNWSLGLDDIALINGLSGRCLNNIDLKSFNGRSFRMDFQPDFINNGYFSDIEVDYEFLNTPCSSNKKASEFNGNKFEFGYSITTHLSQGSQYDKVLFYYEKMGDRDMQKRQLYTGITRAKDMLILVQ
jgi:exodeoxyribonuclease-5